MSVAKPVNIQVLNIILSFIFFSYLDLAKSMWYEENIIKTTKRSLVVF